MTQVKRRGLMALVVVVAAMAVGAPTAQAAKVRGCQTTGNVCLWPDKGLRGKPYAVSCSRLANVKQTLSAVRALVLPTSIRFKASSMINGCRFALSAIAGVRGGSAGPYTKRIEVANWVWDLGAKGLNDAIYLVVPYGR